MGSAGGGAARGSSCGSGCGGGVASRGGRAAGVLSAALWTGSARMSVGDMISFSLKKRSMAPGSLRRFSWTGGMAASAAAAFCSSSLRCFSTTAPILAMPWRFSRTACQRSSSSSLAFSGAGWGRGVGQPLPSLKTLAAAAPRLAVGYGGSAGGSRGCRSSVLIAGGRSSTFAVVGASTEVVGRSASSRRGSPLPLVLRRAVGPCWAKAKGASVARRFLSRSRRSLS
mmetsp:Transcript_13549/g.40949  ORF Transcript_13549/g.40949 Transcript_13549/m.40949 type:complete len:227 (+) Transcript_13549:156-836(+)